jgi:Fur family transcriptional regulator, ferric uptake regulator
MKEKPFELLKKNRLSITDGRLKVLELFYRHNAALSHGEVERELGPDFDRVTIYRTLHTFEEKGIIHSIPTNENFTRYALCQDACGEGHHHDSHIHFVCDSCNQTTCVSQVTIPSVELPEGYKLYKIDMIANGVCKNCQH